MVSKRSLGFIALFLLVVVLLGFGVSSQSSGSSEEVLEGVANQTGSNKEDLNATPSNVSEISSEKNVYGEEVDVFEIQGGGLENEPVMAITAGGSSQKKPSEGIEYTRSILSFGHGKEDSGSRFLNSPSGAKTSKDSGTVMFREGSITGISTSLNDNSDAGEIEIRIYKNGEQVGLRNSFEGISSGIKKDIDRQSKGLVKFDRGDHISVQLVTSGSNSWSNVNTNLEITTQ